MTELTKTEDALIDVSRTSNWYAWINLLPPPPNDFHVVGDVEVPNPGVKAILTPRSPQGINPRILLLDLLLVQQPGFWPQIVTSVQAHYDKVVSGSPYDVVTIFSNDEPIAEVRVEEAH